MRFIYFYLKSTYNPQVKFWLNYNFGLIFSKSVILIVIFIKI